MKAIRVHEFGGSEVLRLEEVPQPRPGPGQVREQKHAGGRPLGSLDAFVRHL
jgi:NADPH2:quinone reductase